MVEHGYYLISENFKAAKLAKGYIAAVGLWMVSILYVFWYFAPVTYGNADLTADQVMSLAWRETWDLIIHKQ